MPDRAQSCAPGAARPGGSDERRAGGASRAAAAAQVFVEDPAAPVVLDEDAHHLARVLRLRSGEQVVAADGRGTWAMCEFSGGPDPASMLTPISPPVFEAAPSPAIGVAFAPVKGDRPEWVVQKLTELGVDDLWPLSSAHSVVRWEGDRAERALVRLRRVAREAAAQSRRTWLPVVHGMGPLHRFLEGCGPATVAMAQPGGGAMSLGHRIIAIGPEGGWSAAELDLGVATVGLGPQVLRAETAAVTAGALLGALRDGVVTVAGESGEFPPTAGPPPPAGVGDSG